MHTDGGAPARLQRARGAQEQWKRGWNARLTGSLALAVALHAGVLTLWPQFRVDGPFSRPGEPVSLVYVPGVAAMRAPGPPGELARPALPMVADLDLSIPDHFGVPLPDFTDPHVVELPPPPVPADGGEWVTYQRFAPAMVHPQIRNRLEVRRFLERHYQPVLDQTGVQGVVRMRYWIDEDGTVRKAEMEASSGHGLLDRLALQLSEILRFRPALRSGSPVRVQVVIPVAFREVS